MVVMYIAFQFFTSRCGGQKAAQPSGYGRMYPREFYNDQPTRPPHRGDAGMLPVGDTYYANNAVQPGDTRAMAASPDRVGNDKIDLGTGCMSETGQFVSSNLLPKQDPQMKGWSQFAPKGPLAGQDLLLEPEQWIGADTVSNSQRNASYDLRKEPPIPVRHVSPWINSTIGPDLTRKPLEDCNVFPTHNK